MLKQFFSRSSQRKSTRKSRNRRSLDRSLRGEVLESRRVLAGIPLYAAFANDLTEVHGSSIDEVGNQYVYGQVHDGATDFDGNAVTASPGGDIFVAKLDPQGVQDFFATAGGIGNSGKGSADSIFDVHADANGDIYVVGTVAADIEIIDFDGNSYLGSGTRESDLFAAKLDGSGVQQYFKLAGGDSSDSIRAVHFDVDGTVNIAGSIDQDSDQETNLTDFAGNSLAEPTNSAAYVASIASDGSQAFFETAINLNPQDMQVVNGTTYVYSSAFRQFEDFDGNTFGDASARELQLSVAAIDSAGNQQYLRSMPAAGTNVGPFQVDVAGNVTISGRTPFVDPITDFDGNAVVVSTNSIFAASLDVAGNQRFHVTATGGSSTWIRDIETDSSGNVFLFGRTPTGETTVDFAGNSVTGNGDIDAFVAKLDASGVQQLFETFGGNAFDGIQQAHVDALGNITLIGSTSSSTISDFNGASISTPGVNNLVISRLDSTGNQVYFSVAGGSSINFWDGLQVDEDGKAYTSGLFQGLNDPIQNFDGTMLPSTRNGVSFVAKFAETGEIEYFYMDGDSPGTALRSIAIGQQGTFYVAGEFRAGTIDFGGNLVSNDVSFAVSIAEHRSPLVTPDADLIYEDDPIGTVSGNVLTNDADPEGVPLTVAAVQGDPAAVGDTISMTYGSVSIGSDGSYLYTLANAQSNVQSLADGETVTELITYAATDGQFASTSDLTIKVVGRNDAPTANADTFTVDENSPNMTIVGSVDASDVDNGNSIAYSIVGGNIGGAFVIDSGTGKITVANSSALDFDTNPSFNLIIQVQDDLEAIGAATVTINLNNLPDDLPVPDQIDGTVDDVQDLLDEGTLSKGEAKPVINHLKQALKHYNKGKDAKAISKLAQSRDEIEDLINSGDLAQTVGDELLIQIDNVINDILEGN
ncbi:VCBS domain-containing protein [Novipirellula sp. SH528]|uniref:VCBS domain-containing protein n=1 Tax=Novipirellula sp. SH528 TaxID=3454466 RepID=UPI003FA171B2